ncbi:hypothetical protein ATHL_02511 [Anaerolinea thermolimosa]|uniref:hypothetical protein n=1 Tax=Anaerolinea thermolimosa TaxID=229919 RepID=UPI00078502DF|nr:hypothetical protein [Anaerolinea thermolimosa]GAP07625.1 hypothetical protein ATHL_02511 [Anaerolinea thermolimosa]
MAGRKNQVFLAVGIMVLILTLGAITGTGEASFRGQTVPTLSPTSTPPPPEPTNTSQVIEPTQATQPTVVPTLAPTEPQTASTATTGSQPAATSTTAGQIPATPTLGLEQQPSPTPVPSATQGTLKTVYFLACGLGLIVAIGLILLLAIRKPTTPPSGSNHP